MTGLSPDFRKHTFRQVVGAPLKVKFLSSGPAPIFAFAPER